AWWLHRARHLRRLPSAERRVRVLMDWVLGGVFSREVVSLGAMEHPRSAFEGGFGPRSDRPSDGGPDAAR
ncbi:NAD(P)/FAD-dependent oxidoreductase, partial [Kitasatospora sp. NPDC127116]